VREECEGKNYLGSFRVFIVLFMGTQHFMVSYFKALKFVTTPNSRYLRSFSFLTQQHRYFSVTSLITNIKHTPSKRCYF